MIFFSQKGEVDYKSELQLLEREGEMPLDELLASLPPGLLEEQHEDSSMEGEEEEPVTESMHTRKGALRSTRYCIVYMYVFIVHVP